MPKSAIAAKTHLRPDIQGLRAVAVLLVVAYHLWPHRLTGGYVGVDVFFVISGFLICGHLLREVHTTGRIRLGRFWARRARRLLPASLLVLAATAVATWIWVPQMHWQQFAKEIAASALYAQNWVLSADSVDYMAAGGASPVEHYWSLSAEEQFYLVWPLLILVAVAAVRRVRTVSRRHSIAVVISAMTIASFGYGIYLTSVSPAAAYFVTPSRAWEFGAGALLALVPVATGKDAARTAASWLGLASIACAAVVLTAATPFPGYAALLPVTGTVLVIWAGLPAGGRAAGHLLALRPATFIGDISYSVYLWHWPQIVILPFVLGHELGWRSKIAICAATLLLAWASKVGVEDPMRTATGLGLRRTGVTFAASAAAMTLVVGLAAGTWTHIDTVNDQQRQTVAAYENAPPPCFGAAARVREGDGCPNRALDSVIIPRPNNVQWDYADYPQCLPDNDSGIVKRCVFGDEFDADLPRLALVGDSHARALLPAFIQMAKEHRIVLEGYVKGGCMWSTSPPEQADDAVARSCIQWRKGLQHQLMARSGDLDLIVTTGWSKLYRGSLKQREAAIARAWKPLIKRDVPIVALRDNPQPPKDPNECLAALDGTDFQACSFDRRTGFRFPDALPGAVRQTNGTQLLDFSRLYCRADACPVVIGGVNVYRDHSHLTTTFTKSMEPLLLRRLQQTGLL